MFDNRLSGVGEIDGVEIVVAFNNVDQLWEFRDPILRAEASIFKKIVEVFQTQSLFFLRQKRAVYSVMAHTVCNVAPGAAILRPVWNWLDCFPWGG